MKIYPLALTIFTRQPYRENAVHKKAVLGCFWVIFAFTNSRLLGFENGLFCVSCIPRWKWHLKKGLNCG